MVSLLLLLTLLTTSHHCYTPPDRGDLDARRERVTEPLDVTVSVGAEALDAREECPLLTLLEVAILLEVNAVRAQLTATYAHLSHPVVTLQPDFTTADRRHSVDMKWLPRQLSAVYGGTYHLTVVVDGGDAPALVQVRCATADDVDVMACPGPSAKPNDGTAYSHFPHGGMAELSYKSCIAAATCKIALPNGAQLDEVACSWALYFLKSDELPGDGMRLKRCALVTALDEVHERWLRCDTTLPLA